MRPAALPAAALVAACALLAGCGTGASSAASTGGASSAAASASTTPAGPTTAASATASRPATGAPTPSTPAATSRTRGATSGAAPGAVLPAVPRRGAQPATRFPADPAAVGSGANARVSSVPDGVWARMVGYSWTSGCPVGRSSLRYVTVNFWGFDGVRHRGALVVHRSAASGAAQAFTSLYAQHFRIRQMRVMDSSWGRMATGKGANDVAAMNADNTSAFNCRYVVGREKDKVWSNHAYGKAIDVNDFENPYVADDGTVYPDAYWLHRRSPAPGVFAGSGGAPVRAFTSLGFRWGGLWSHPDLQHFELS